VICFAADFALCKLSLWNFYILCNPINMVNNLFIQALFD